MLFVGIDPDLHSTAIAVWCGDQRCEGPDDVWIVETKKKKGVIEQAAVLEMAWAVSEFFCAFNMRGPGDLDEVVYCVEAQTLQISDNKKKHRRPQDIVTLGNVAGAVIGSLFGMCCNPDHLLFPTPWQWKGSKPKAVMQSRFYTEMGWGYKVMGKNKNHPNGEYAIPLKTPAFASDLKPAHWKHVGDALMLARWASKNWKPK